MKKIQLFFLLTALLDVNIVTAQTLGLSKNAYGRSERIKVTYSNVPLPSANGLYIINITGKKNPDKGLENYKYVKDESSGVIELHQMGYDGVYEVRLLKYKNSADTEPVVVSRVEFTIGTPPLLSKNFICKENIPAVTNRIISGAPTAKQITTIIRGILAEGNAPLGKTGKDVCVEFGPITYLPKSTVKLFSDWNSPGQAALPAWPVKVKVTVKIPKGEELEIKEAGTGKDVFYFYKDSKGSWNFKGGTLKS